MEKKDFTSKYTEKLSKAMVRCLPFFDYSRAKAAISKKDVIVNNKREKTDINIKVGDKISVYFSEPNVISDNYYKVIFADDQVLIVDKSAGIETTNVKGDSLSHLLGKKYGEVYAVHRLDRNTSGLVIFAKTKEAEQVLNDAFKTNKIIKTYIAKCVGKLPKTHDIVHAYLLKDSEKVKVSIFNNPTKNAVEIITEYKVISYINDVSTVEVILHTGKTHQIRAQLSHLGNPIIGDGKYGKADDSTLQLRSVGVRFRLDDETIISYLNAKTFLIK